MASLLERFGYAFQGKDRYPPTADRLADLPDDFHHRRHPYYPKVVDQPHGAITSAGLRFDWDGYSAGYSTDFNALTDDHGSAVQGRGEDVEVLDALRITPHPTHPNLEKGAGLDPAAQARLGRADAHGQFDGLSHAYRRILPDGVEQAMTGWNWSSADGR